MMRLGVFLLTFVIVAGVFYLLLKSQWIWSLNQARRKGRLPSAKKATMFDVRQLIIENEIELAVELYIQIFGGNRKEARSAVDELQKSIQEKNIDPTL